MDIVFNFENLVIAEKPENYKQSTIDDFFRKNWKKTHSIIVTTHHFPIFVHPENMPVTNLFARV